MIGLGAGFGPSRLGVADMANISYHISFVFDFITILCHVVFSI